MEKDWTLPVYILLKKRDADADGSSRVGHYVIHKFVRQYRGWRHQADSLSQKILGHN